MNDSSYTNWVSMSDTALVQSIAAYVKHQRLEQNRTQGEVAASAGISRSTLSLLERGETVTVITLLQVLRVLDLLHIMDAFKIQEQISPLVMAKLEQKKRRRAGNNEQTDQFKSNW